MLPSVLFENTEANEVETVIFLSGFPDDQTSGMIHLIDRFRLHNKNLRLVCLCYPDFDKASANRRKPFGYTFSQALSMLEDTVDHFMQSQHGQRVTIIAHDWGCYLGALYENKNPSRVKRMIMLDVGTSIDYTFINVFIILLYQLWFSFAYLVSQTISHHLGHVIFLMYSIVSPLVGPVPDRPSRKLREISVTQCYVYYQFWRAMIFSRKQVMRPRFPTCPTLFMYGTKKRASFHSKSFLEHLNRQGLDMCDEYSSRRSKPRCRQVALNCGHWVQRDCADEVYKEIADFLI